VLVDSHCHIDSPDFDTDRDDVVRRAQDAGVLRMVAIDCLELSARFEGFFSTIGVHPHEALKADLKRIEEGVRHPKVIAVGEIGLDYHYDFSPRDVQRAVFIDQIAIARGAGLPIVIHTRLAWEETFDILREHWAPAGIPGIMHSFTGGPAEARQALEMGFYLSFSGMVTFPKAVDIQQAAREAPLDRILVETDAPYLAPVPKRGKRNEPAFVVHTAHKIAALRELSFEEIAAATTNNFEKLCSLRAPRYTEEFNVQ
jgi:TatD DNase family protein